MRPPKGTKPKETVPRPMVRFVIRQLRRNGLDTVTWCDVGERRSRAHPDVVLTVFLHDTEALAGEYRIEGADGSWHQARWPVKTTTTPVEEEAAA